MMADKLTVDDDLIRRLARLLEETGLSEIEIGEGQQHVRVARADGGGALGAVPLPADTVAALPEDSQPAATEVDASHPGAVVSPMVGTLYLAPEPGAPPFAALGSTIREGDTMFIIEAMKTMNPVRAPRDGKVTRVLVSNETPVEYGEVLALVE